MHLGDYFSTRCMNTLDVIQNMEALFNDLRQRTQHPQLREMVEQHHNAIVTERDNMMRINERVAQGELLWQEPQQTGERLIIVGRGWVGSVETHRIFIGQIPQELVDVNTALLMEEMVHFNLGNYTGLIVLAKQLGEQDVAGMLQHNIDLEDSVRRRIEESLWWIVQSLQQHQEAQEHPKAA